MPAWFPGYNRRIITLANKAVKKTVMITGATGFVGSHLALTLAERGYHVRALVRNKSKAKHLEKAGVELVLGDLVRGTDVEAAAKGTQIIYHIAALYRSVKYPNKIYKKVNVEGTRNVINAAEKLGIPRLVHCSTVGVHGDIKSIPANEDAPFNPTDIYQKTKLEAEMLVAKAIKRGLHATIFRPVGVYGPGDMRFLKLFKNIHSGKFFMLGLGEVLYHLIYIDDLVEGAILCGERQDAIGRTYILAGPRYTTIIKLSDLVAKALGKDLPARRLPLAPFKLIASVCKILYKPFGIEPPLYPRRLDFFCKSRAFTSRRARRELGFRPKVDLAEGLARTAKWYFDQGLLEGKPPVDLKAREYPDKDKNKG